MINFANLAIRWAFAYLLIVNSIDTVTDKAALNYTASGNIWLDSLIMLAATISIVGGVLLASGWQLRNTALLLAVTTGLFALIYQAPIAIMISIGLLILAYSTKNTTRKTIKIPENTFLTRNRKIVSDNKPHIGISLNRICRS